MQIKYNREVLYSLAKYIDNEQFEVIVIVDQPNYYNIHIISETFRDDRLNTLALQEPKECIVDPDSYFNETKLLEYILRHCIWSHFNVDVDSLTLTARED